MKCEITKTLRYICSIDASEMAIMGKGGKIVQRFYGQEFFNKGEDFDQLQIVVQSTPDIDMSILSSGITHRKNEDLFNCKGYEALSDEEKEECKKRMTSNFEKHQKEMLSFAEEHSQPQEKENI